MRRLIVLLAALAALMALSAGTAFGWPAPGVSGDCDGWYVTETATDRDWKEAAYWTIDGVDGQHERGVTVFVADDSDATEREFTIRWFNGKGKQLDVRSTVGYRDLSGCEEPPPPAELVFTFTATGGACEASLRTFVLDVPDDPAVVGYTALFDDGGDAIGRDLEPGVDVIIDTGIPVEGDITLHVVVSDPGGNDVFEATATSSPPPAEECEEEPPPTTPTTTPEPPTTEPPTDTTQPPAPPTTEPPAPPTTPTQPPAPSTTAAPAPDGDVSSELPWTIPAGTALTLISLFALARRKNTNDAS